MDDHARRNSRRYRLKERRRRTRFWEPPKAAGYWHITSFVAAQEHSLRISQRQDPNSFSLSPGTVCEQAQPPAPAAVHGGRPGVEAPEPVVPGLPDHLSAQGPSDNGDPSQQGTNREPAP